LIAAWPSFAVICSYELLMRQVRPTASGMPGRAGDRVPAWRSLVAAVAGTRAGTGSSRQLLLIVAAVGQLVLSIRARHPVIIGASVIGLIAILAATSSGASFLSDQSPSSSLGMALATAVAMLCYRVCLRIEGERA
jgi:hypothetical protein